jgi:hypothetical protein
MTKLLEMRIDNPIQVEPVVGDNPSMRLTVGIRFTLDHSPNPRPSKEWALDWVPQVQLNGIALRNVHDETGLIHQYDLTSGAYRQAKFVVELDRESLRRIEAHRVHDVSLVFTLRLKGITGAPDIQPFFIDGQGITELSETKWLKMLDSLQYKSSWIIEMERPHIEGWDTVKSHLEKAANDLATRDADGVMNHCRATWKAVEPLLESQSSAIATLIDQGSKGEPNEPSKSKRVEAIQRAVTKLTHVGPHSEHYVTTMEDATLAYQLTVSTLSYLSRKAHIAATEANPPSIT